MALVFKREDGVGRNSVYPILNTDTWELYKTQQAAFWTAEEIDLEKDPQDFESSFNENERRFIMMTLAFFSGFDNLVMKNISLNFENEVNILEARYFYTAQNYIEGVHAETYAILIDALVPNDQKATMFTALESFPSVKRKADWASEYMDPSIPIGERLLAWAVVEGIFFSGSFCSIYWIKAHKPGKMHGLTFSNELISRDEGMHRDFAIHLIRRLREPLSEEKANAIIKTAVDIEKEFVRDALPVGVIGMNSESMSQYIEFVADHLYRSIGFDHPIFGTPNPFSFMELISLVGKSNFFEARVSDYQNAHIKSKQNFVFSVNEDF